jgi:hypothetical protein
VISIRAAVLTGATVAQLTEVADVFDQYRHYGEAAAPWQTLGGQGPYERLRQKITATTTPE